MNASKMNCFRLGLYFVVSSIGTTLAMAGCEEGPNTSSSSGGSGGAGGGSGGECIAGTTDALPNLKLTELVTDLERPVYVTGAPNDPTRLFVVLKSGRILLLKDGALQAEPFLDLSAIVESAANERGLLGLVFHPGYAENGRFFVYYTSKASGSVTLGSIVISECARAPGTQDKALGACIKDFLTIPHDRTNHNGGMLAFGPDGYLYIGTGDGGGAGDPDENGQNTMTKLGKILRIDVDKYPTPPSGNFTGGDPDIWDWGLRNPWRFSFDRCSGDLYIADVGQFLWEEVNVEPKGQGRLNYGWNTMEGKHCFDPEMNCDQTGLTMPVTEYPHDDNVMDVSVTGGYVYRGKKIPGLEGTYIYADYLSRRIRTLAWSKGAILKEGEVTQDLDTLTLTGGITSFGEDSEGELYLVIDNNQDGTLGKLYRIDPE